MSIIENRMLEEYLSETLGSCRRGRHSTCEDTTRQPAMFPESVKQWQTILDDLPLLNDRLARRNDETENNHHWLGGQKVVTSESQLAAFVTCVAQVVACATGGHEATTSPQSLTRKPDTHIFEVFSGKVKMVGRVIPFWDLYVHEHSLVALWEEGTQSLQQGSTNQTLHEHFQERHDDEYCICNNGAYILHGKAYEVIGEMSELMVGNQLKYGFLTTWNLWWFLRLDGRTLWISRSFARDERDPTVCQVLGRLLLVAMNDFELNVVSTLSGATKMKKRKRSNSGSMTSCEVNMTPVVNVGDSRTYHDLCVAFSGYIREISSDSKRLSDFMSSLKMVWLGYGHIGKSFKAIVDMGGNKHLEVVVKSAKTSELDEDLEFEAYVYKKLSRFQGKCIPYIFGDAPILYDHSKCMLMSFEGPTMDKVDVTSIPLWVRERAWEDATEIENAGVAKHQMRMDDMCWNAQRQRIVEIDFSFVYLRDEKRSFDSQFQTYGGTCGLYEVLHLPRYLYTHRN